MRMSAWPLDPNNSRAEAKGSSGAWAVFTP